MNKSLQRILCFLAALTLLINMLPLNALAAKKDSKENTEPSQTATTDTEIEDAQIIGEVTEKRTEFSKEFVLSNGLHMATVYAEAVHYEENGEWKDIDNTLQQKSIDGENSYVNTDGIWNVAFPQQLSDENGVSIEKDGYTLEFFMSGEIHAVPDTETASGEILSAAEPDAATFMMEIGDTAVPMLLAEAEEATAEVQPIDLSQMIAEAEHPETISENLHSRLEYADVYANTDIIYDLNSNQLKESIVMEQYNDTLHGYRYALAIGELLPVLTDDGSIELYDKTGENVVMIMPAPYLVDNGQQYCYDVDVDLQKNGDTYVLTYLLPQEWLADNERQWPVVLDPIVSANSTVKNIEDVTIGSKIEPGYLSGVLLCGYRNAYGIMRSYIKFKNLPVLTSSDVIVNAYVSLHMPYSSGTVTCIEMHKVIEEWTSQNLFWDGQGTAFNPTIEDFAIYKGTGTYVWNITDIVRGWYEGTNSGMMFKNPSSIENAGSESWKQFVSSDYSIFDDVHKPALTIMFRNNNGLESYWDYTSASAGRAGTGCINNYTGNLVWVHEDIGFDGNLMPVSVSHIYNANDSLNNDFGLGSGWRTNFNQRVRVWDVDKNYYVWEDSDGTRHYFSKNEEDNYVDEDGLELTLTTTGSQTEKYCITDKYGNCSYFDALGRLVKMENNQATKSNISIAYTTAEGYRISTVTDGAGRVYSFTYTDGLLTRISYLGTGETEISYVTFQYTDSSLTSITNKDNQTATYTYWANNLLATAQDIDGYKLSYTYNTLEEGKPARVATVTESDGTVNGGELNIEYAKNQTTFEDHNGNVQIMQFNNLGNTISIQDDQGRAQYMQYAINDTSDTATAATSTTTKANQLMLSSKLQNTVGNILDNSSFERDTLWTASSNAVTQTIVSDTAYLGDKSLKLSCNEAADVSTTFAAEAGATYTFSAYVKTGADTAAYLALGDGTTTVTGSTLAAGSDWTRLEVSFTSNAAATLTAQLMTENAGAVYMDCVQIEKAPTASRYNLVENGDFRYTTAWDASTERVTCETAAAPELSTDVYSMTGIPNATNRISQTVQVSGAAGDSFVVGGWAKGNSVPLEAFDTNPREFGIIATFNNTDGTETSFTVHFNPYTDSSVSWQYAAAPIVAAKDYSSVKIELAYDYNANTMYFDGIQLYKEAFGTSYAYDENGNIKSVVDIQGQETKYEYDKNNLTAQIIPDKARLTYEYDEYHNVVSAKTERTLEDGTTETVIKYGFAYDAWGNNTAVSIMNENRAVISSTAVYSEDGNRLVSTTDTSGNTTLYGYNADTNVLEWVQYPKDTEETRTEYIYDQMYRVISIDAATDMNSLLTSEYRYEDNLLDSLITNSTTYHFAYGDFDLRSSVKIGSRTLAEYFYTDDGNNFLEELAYGNDDSVEYTYDDQGRVIRQTYEDGDTVDYRYDNSGALATVSDSATGITTTYYYDFTDRLMKYVESGGDHTHSVSYGYDNLNNLTEIVETIDGVEHTTSYVYDDTNRVTAVSVGNVTTNYTYDAYGRISSQETRQGEATVLTYTTIYQDTADRATSRVASREFSVSGFSVNNTYTYDANGNITVVEENYSNSLLRHVSPKTTYEYDSQNQLIRENNGPANKTWVWTYDGAGNILSREEYYYTFDAVQGGLCVTYSYGNSEWGDLLTSYDGHTITYDEIGNPLSDGTWTYTWEHGRELASMTDGTTTWNYAYDANGMRTTRSNGTTAYSYVYNGSQLSQMTVNSDVLRFTYDASGAPMTVEHNGTIYYYVVNLQGDVIAITNDQGAQIAVYYYDAWGNLVDTLGHTQISRLNPLRYRGYVYDTESGLYYLQSRYYNPEVGRFLNADGYTSTSGLLGNNMFAYCGNNPLTRVDSSGRFWETAFDVISLGASLYEVENNH